MRNMKLLNILTCIFVCILCHCRINRVPARKHVPRKGTVCTECQKTTYQSATTRVEYGHMYMWTSAFWHKFNFNCLNVCFRIFCDCDGKWKQGGNESCANTVFTT